jgi:hypothetical protein
MEGFKHASTGNLRPIARDPRKGEIKTVMAAMELERLRGENEALLQQNQMLSISQRENILLKARLEECQLKCKGKDAMEHREHQAQCRDRRIERQGAKEGRENSRVGGGTKE